MKALITGGSGFIGSHIMNLFDYEFENIDIQVDRDIRKANIKGSPKICFHLASKCIVRDCITTPNIAFRNNVEGTFNIMEGLRRKDVKELILFSSSRVLSKEKNTYTASKTYAEGLAEAYWECYGIKYKIIRPSTVYGELDKTDRIIPRFIRAAFNGRPLVIYGDDKKTLDLTYIRDFMNAFKLVMDSPVWNTDYNIANGKEVNVFEIAKYVKDITGSKSEIVFRDSEVAQPQRVKVDINKIRMLGYRPQMDWKKGVAKTIAWLKNDEELTGRN